MTDQLSLLQMLDDAEHPTWLLNGSDKEIRATKRALWLARAERALEKIALAA